MLQRVSCSGIVSLGVLGVALFAQEPKFEVASVRANNSGPRGDSVYQLEAGRLTLTNAPLLALILDAYSLPGPQVVGAPAWIMQENFDIVAKAESDRATPSELLLMLRPLLAERFQTKSHFEERRAAGFVMTVGRDGAKVKASDPAETADRIRFGSAAVSGRRVTMADLAAGLARRFSAPVIDHTGLAGQYTFSVPLEPGIRYATPEFYEELRRAIASQLGLRFEQREVTAPFLVIESIARPTDN